MYLHLKRKYFADGIIVGITNTNKVANYQTAIF